MYKNNSNLIKMCFEVRKWMSLYTYYTHTHTHTHTQTHAPHATQPTHELTLLTLLITQHQPPQLTIYIYVYIYIHPYIHIHAYTYVYTYIYALGFCMYPPPHMTCVYPPPRMTYIHIYSRLLQTARWAHPVARPFFFCRLVTVFFCRLRGERIPLLVREIYLSIYLPTYLSYFATPFTSHFTTHFTTHFTAHFTTQTWSSSHAPKDCRRASGLVSSS